MKLLSKKAQNILNRSGKLSKPSWGTRQCIRVSDMGDIRHFSMVEDGIHFENYALSYFELYLDEWDEIK